MEERLALQEASALLADFFEKGDRINKSMSECDLVFAFTDLHELHKWRLDYE